jgi:hypothetical protein
MVLIMAIFAVTEDKGIHLLWGELGSKLSDLHEKDVFHAFWETNDKKSRDEILSSQESTILEKVEGLKEISYFSIIPGDGIMIERNLVRKNSYYKISDDQIKIHIVTLYSDYIEAVRQKRRAYAAKASAH